MSGRHVGLSCPVNEAGDHSLRKLPKYVAHTFILSGDDRDQLEVGEHEDELTTGASTLFALIRSGGNLVVLNPPEVPV